MEGLRLLLPEVHSVSIRPWYLGILHCNQRWPPEKKKNQFGPVSFYKTAGSTQAEYFKAIPMLKIVTSMVINAINISSLVTKNSGLIAIMVPFFCVEDQ